MSPPGAAGVAPTPAQPQAAAGGLAPAPGAADPIQPGTAIEGAGAAFVGKGKSTYRVNAKPLIEHYGVKVEKKLTVTPKWNKSEGLLELAL